MQITFRIVLRLKISWSQVKHMLTPWLLGLLCNACGTLRNKHLIKLTHRQIVYRELMNFLCAPQNHYKMGSSWIHKNQRVDFSQTRLGEGVAGRRKNIAKGTTDPRGLSSWGLRDGLTKKAAVLFDFVKMSGGGPWHLLISAFLVNKRSLLSPKCQ